MLLSDMGMISLVQSDELYDTRVLCFWLEDNVVPHSSAHEGQGCQLYSLQAVYHIGSNTTEGDSKDGTAKQSKLSLPAHTGQQGLTCWL